MSGAESVLVADIGGTNARFAIARRPNGAGRVELDHVLKLQAEDYEDIRDAIDAYFEMAATPRPRLGCVAVAGPAHGEEISLTNARWCFRPAELAGRIGLQRLYAVNDWAAVAAGAGLADAEHVGVIAPGVSAPDAPVVALGPGTGLGMGYFVRGRHDRVVVATEGGHAAFGPRDEREVEIWRFIRAEHDYVSYERLLSGRGLVSIHRALCAKAGVARANLRPDEITQAAMDGDPALPIARDAVETFCAILGSYAASMTVALGARGGVYIGGGILPRVRSILEAGAFLARFRDAGPMSPYLADVPVTLLLRTEETALLGAATLAHDKEAARP